MQDGIWTCNLLHESHEVHIFLRLYGETAMNRTADQSRYCTVCHEDMLDRCFIWQRTTHDRCVLYKVTLLGVRKKMCKLELKSLLKVPTRKSDSRRWVLLLFPSRSPQLLSDAVLHLSLPVICYVTLLHLSWIHHRIPVCKCYCRIYVGWNNNA